MYLTEKNIELFKIHHVYTETEMRSRYEIMLENYVKTIKIEANVMIDMIYKQILPAVGEYTKAVSETGVMKRTLSTAISTEYEEKLAARLSSLSSSIASLTEELESEVHATDKITDMTEASFAIKGKVIDILHTQSCSSEFRNTKDTLNKSDFCDKRLKYRVFCRKNNIKSEAY